MLRILSLFSVWTAKSYFPNMQRPGYIQEYSKFGNGRILQALNAPIPRPQVWTILVPYPGTR